MIPELDLITGKQPDVPELPPVESQNRFNYVFKNFIKALTGNDIPMVLFLDDLQWADSASYTLLQMILSDSSLTSFYLVGAYRDNEVNPSHPLMNLFEELDKNGIKYSSVNLQPLEAQYINELLSDTLSKSKSE